MKILRRLALWCLAVAVLAGLFRLREKGSSLDERIPVRLLTDEGVLVMTMAEYLPLAVAAEMPASFQPDALRAQAVAARTFALSCKRHQAEGADVCNHSGCCVAFSDEEQLRELWGGGYKKYAGRIASAVAATDGEYLAYAGAPIQAAFHASSLSRTEDSGALWSPLPYLVSVSTPETPELVPGLVTDVTVSAPELVRALGFVPGPDPALWLERLEPDSAGRVRSLTVCGRTYPGSQVRAALDLGSTAFTLRWEDGSFLFTVAGHGHGVGMSQYGAQLFAQQGLGYRDILAHYYPGTELALYTP